MMKQASIWSNKQLSNSDNDDKIPAMQTDSAASIL